MLEMQVVPSCSREKVNVEKCQCEEQRFFVAGASIYGEMNVRVYVESYIQIVCGNVHRNDGGSVCV